VALEVLANGIPIGVHADGVLRLIVEDV